MLLSQMDQTNTQATLKVWNSNQWNEEYTFLRMRLNSLFLNSWRAERLRRSRKSSPLRSTTSSSNCSVDMPRISSRSCSLFAIGTNAATPLLPAGCGAEVSPEKNRVAGTPIVRRPTKAIRAEGAATARGVETRGEAAARDIVTIVLTRHSRSALVAVWLEVERIRRFWFIWLPWWALLVRILKR
jgi:hypothetical protein